MRPRSLRLAALLGLVMVSLSATPALATLSSVSGYAYGESVDVMTPLVLPVHVISGPLPTAGPLASPGDNFTSSVASACVGVSCAVLSAGVLNVHTEGTLAGGVSSTASVAAVNVLVGLITGTLIASQCGVDPSNGATSGSTTLTSVVINGIAIASNPGPNTNLVLLDAGTIAAGSVVLNEQTYDSGANKLVVNAIHVRLGGSLGSGDIIISHVECDASPEGPAPVIPESSYALLLPLTGILLATGLLLIGRRKLALERR